MKNNSFATNLLGISIVNKNIFLFIILILLPFNSFAITSGNEAKRDFAVKIAVVDVEAIFEHSVAVKDLKEKINKINSSIQEEMSAKERDLKKAEEELIKQKGIISENDFQEKVTDFNKKVSKAQQLLQSRKASLDQAHSQAISAVHNASISIISELAKKYGFNIVLPSSQVLHVSNDLNITLEVITMLNNNLKTIELNYNPKDFN